MSKPMKRLTEISGGLKTCSDMCARYDDDYDDCEPDLCIGVEKAIERLVEYENTGLTPEAVERIKIKLAILTAISALSLILGIIRRKRGKS